MQDSSGMRKNIETFQNCVRELSEGLSGVSGIWKDEKYHQISEVFSEVANNSKSVIENGSKCCFAFDSFMIIANEKY